ncbi:MAG TPA: hypothetical protein VI818_04595 [Candidatus Thermoplasmatota archaeon]|nr:hypothetical protein [Candidatus Thermoplasmatota archaeon]
MRHALAFALAAALLLVPGAQAQSLEEQFADFHFKRVRFTFSWDDDRKVANMYARAEDLEIRGEGARDLRECIDGGECPLPDLGRAAAASTKDGEITREELDSFTFNLETGLRLYDDVKAIQQNVKGIVKVDDKTAGSAILTDVQIDGAVGEVNSGDSLHLHATITATFGTVKPASTHKVWMQRTQSNLTIADEIVVEGGKNWRIVEASIEPATMGGFFDDGRLQGSQDEFESRDPLVFTVEYHKESSTALMVGGSVVVLAAAAGAGAFYLRRRKV